MTVNPAITLGSVSYVYQSDNVLRDTAIYGTPYSWQVYAGPNFEFSAGVPEPAAWAMLLLGFFGLGALLRGARRKQSNVIAAA